jgi:hypothetical protein
MVVERFQSAFCVIEISQITVHEADELKPVFDFDADLWPEKTGSD